VLLGLEGVSEFNNEGVLAHNAHDVALGHCVLAQILLLDALLLQHFHRKQLFVSLSLNKEDFTE
jgi:hypothetical protein